MSKKKRKTDKTGPETPVGEPSSAKALPVVGSRNKFWMIIALVSVVINAGLVYGVFHVKEGCAECDTLLSDCMVKLEDTQLREEEHKNKVTTMERQLRDLRSAGVVPGGGLSSEVAEEYRKRGLSNPENRIVYDLIQHAELIPYPAAEGAKMVFTSKDAIHLLSPNLVFARFGDGHTTGHMVLEYQVGNKGVITWKVLRAYQD